MYYPDKYDDHNNALKRFINIFNDHGRKYGCSILMHYHTKENYKDDGIVIYRPAMRSIGYDFEKRHTAYQCYGKHTFKKLSQFERKLVKPMIDLSIQCSTNEDAVLIGWHSDFLKSPIETYKAKTKDGFEKQMRCRSTEHFREYSYSDRGEQKGMDALYRVILGAFINYQFNYRSYRYDQSER